MADLSIVGPGMNGLRLPVGVELVIVTDRGEMVKLAAEPELPKP